MVPDFSETLQFHGNWNVWAYRSMTDRFPGIVLFFTPLQKTDLSSPTTGARHDEAT
jgi:hypothetical protein